MVMVTVELKTPLYYSVVLMYSCTFGYVYDASTSILEKRKLL